MNTVGINSIALWKMALSVRKEAMEKATQQYNSYVAEIRHKITEDLFIAAYTSCALSSSTDAGNDPLDKNYNQDDIALETLFEMVQDCFNFRVNNAADLKDLELEKCGHDFWLARNGHEAGFRESNLGVVGARLRDAAAKLGGAHLRVGDDGQIHQLRQSP
jgi:hypothetical protein